METPEFPYRQDPMLVIILRLRKRTREWLGNFLKLHVLDKSLFNLYVDVATLGATSVSSTFHCSILDSFNYLFNVWPLKMYANPILFYLHILYVLVAFVDLLLKPRLLSKVFNERLQPDPQNTSSTLSLTLITAKNSAKKKKNTKSN